MTSWALPIFDSHHEQLLLILLLAVAIHRLNDELTSIAARISRVALLPYLVSTAPSMQSSARATGLL